MPQTAQFHNWQPKESRFQPQSCATWRTLVVSREVATAAMKVRLHPCHARVFVSFVHSVECTRHQAGFGFSESLTEHGHLEKCSLRICTTIRRFDLLVMNDLWHHHLFVQLPRAGSWIGGKIELETMIDSSPRQRPGGDSAKHKSFRYSDVNAAIVNIDDISCMIRMQEDSLIQRNFQITYIGISYLRSPY